MDREQGQQHEVLSNLRWEQKLTKDARKRCFGKEDANIPPIAQVISGRTIFPKLNPSGTITVEELIEGKKEAVQTAITNLEELNNRFSYRAHYDGAWIPRKDWREREELTPNDVVYDPFGVMIFAFPKSK